MILTIIRESLNYYENASKADMLANSRQVLL